MNNIIIKSAINRRQMKFLTHLCTIISISANLVFSSLMAFILYNITKISKSDWHNDNVLYATSAYDPLFEEKIDLIIGILVIVAIVIIVFTLILIYMMNKICLNKLNNLINVYCFMGYTKKHVHKIAVTEIFIDYVLIIPISISAIFFIWKAICKNDTIINLFRYINAWKHFNYVFFIVAVIIIIFITELQILLWLKSRSKSDK